MGYKKLFTKKSEPDPITEFIHGELVDDTPPEPPSYLPTEFDTLEAEDIGNQLADHIIEFMKEHSLNPIPGDQPLDLRRAAELCTIATTQQHVGFLLLKQQECDLADSSPWWMKHWHYLILGGAFACLPLLVILAYAILTKSS